MGEPLDLGERGLERAEAYERFSKDAVLARLRSRLALPGAPWCIECGAAIDPARRQALPSARRCITCQSRREMRR